MPPEVILQLPDRLTAHSISEFASSIHAAPPGDEYVFDFGKSRWFPPFSMLLLSMQLRRFRAERPDSICSALNFENHTYAAHMGFFQAFGLDHGNAPGQASGSHTYVPIEVLERSALLSEAQRRFIEVGSVIESHAARLATMLLQREVGALHDTLTFSIREIMRNVIEHSEAPAVMFCAQYWPSRGEVEVGIADAGRGVRAGLADNPSFEPSSDREALHLALMPGVSGNTAAGRGDSPWQNSGYGLYMTNRIFRRGGSFFISSGNAGLWLQSDVKRDVVTDLHGTVVRLFMDTAKVDDLDKLLKRFRDEGQASAKEIRGAVQTNASAASRMLARDFQ